MWTKLNDLIVSLYTRAQLAKDEGQTAVEYALVIGLVSVVIVTALAALKGDVTTLVTEIGTQLKL